MLHYSNLFVIKDGQCRLVGFREKLAAFVHLWECGAHLQLTHFWHKYQVPAPEGRPRAAAGCHFVFLYSLISTILALFLIFLLRLMYGAQPEELWLRPVLPLTKKLDNPLRSNSSGWKKLIC